MYFYSMKTMYFSIYRKDETSVSVHVQAAKSGHKENKISRKIQES